MPILENLHPICSLNHLPDTESFTFVNYVTPKYANRSDAMKKKITSLVISTADVRRSSHGSVAPSLAEDVSAKA